MEDVYQQYKDKVNFLYVYGSEAHPEEYPFQKGFESSDLGWKHRYNVTQSVEERAARAVLWKTQDGPKREMPMIIDFINTPGETNNAIKKAYIGGGFYSGYIVDCDGRVKVAEAWAWFAQGKDWWGLPLAPISKLTQWLDAYLASPPACYGDSSSPVPDDPQPDPDDPAAGSPDPPSSSDPRRPTTPGGPAADAGGCAVAAADAAPAPIALLLLLVMVAMRRRRAGSQARPGR